MKYFLSSGSFIVAFSLCTNCFAGNLSNVSQCKGIWSSRAVSPYEGNSTGTNEISNTNNSISIKSTSGGTFFSTTGKPYELIDIEYSPPLLEVLWSPDGKGFGVNASDGGAVGSWGTTIYINGENGLLTAFDVKKIITPYLDKIAKCDTKEEGNYGIVRWDNQSGEIIVAIESPPHSSCINMGGFSGLKISTKSRSVTGEISSDNLIRDFGGDLGCRFKNSSDSDL